MYCLALGRIMREKNFENKIKDYLKTKNVWFVKYFANSFTPSGIPDLLCCVNGYFLAIEIKAPKGRPSSLQKFTLEKIRESNGLAIVLYPKDFEDFKILVEKLLQNSYKIPQ